MKNGGLYSEDQDNDYYDSMDRYSENYKPLDNDSKHTASSRMPNIDGVIKQENNFDVHVVEDETRSKRHSRSEDAALAMVKILMENNERL